MRIDTYKYVAEILVISEILSICQAIINVSGGSLSYLNLLVFFALISPLLLKIKMSVEQYLLFFGIVIFFILKVILMGVGGYYAKAMILMLSLPIYLIIARFTSFEAIASACSKYRYVIIGIGLTYLVTWYFLGTYRNASTLTAVLMLVLGFRYVWEAGVALILSAVMKTQYKVWFVLSMFVGIFKMKNIQALLLFTMILIAWTTPIILVKTDISWMGLDLSHQTSLQERLMEVSSFLNAFENNSVNWLVGWQPGHALETGIDNTRGYMHSAYLWMTGTFGLPFALAIFLFVATRYSSRKRHFFIRAILVFSNCFTFLLLTNPLCTVLMFSNDKKL